jgi:PAS domain S-box-containing protein
LISKSSREDKLTGVFPNTDDVVATRMACEYFNYAHLPNRKIMAIAYYLRRFTTYDPPRPWCQLECFTLDVTDLHEAESARRESEERLAATYDAATIGIAEADAEGRLLRVNDATCTMLGRSREELLSISVFDYTHEDDRAEDAALYARQVTGEIDNYSIRKRARRPDGTIVHLEVHSSSVQCASGGFRYGVRVLQDVTEAKRMEDRLRESEQHMRDLLDALPAAVYTTDGSGHITFYNKAAVEMSGRTPQPGDMWCVTWRLHNPDGTPLPHDQCPMSVALRENRAVRGAEAIAERPDGTRVPFIPYPTPLRDSGGRLVGAINMLVDITERKQAENRQKVLIDELNHRVKNTLATVQSLAGQTARYAEGLSDFSNRFETRLLALSRVHDQLTKRHWEDAPVDALARELLTPFSTESTERIVIDGPSIALDPRTALSFTMALNELVTNAVKYGALSTEEGMLSVKWRFKADRMLDLEWREQGGPPVKSPRAARIRRASPATPGLKNSPASSNGKAQFRLVPADAIGALPFPPAGTPHTVSPQRR